MNSKIFIIIAVIAIAFACVPIASAQSSYQLRASCIGFVTTPGGSTPVQFLVGRCTRIRCYEPFNVVASDDMDRFRTPAGEDPGGYNVSFPGGYDMDLTGFPYYVAPFTFTIMYGGPNSQSNPIQFSWGGAYWKDDGTTRVIEFDGFVGKVKQKD